MLKFSPRFDVLPGAESCQQSCVWNHTPAGLKTMPVVRCKHKRGKVDRVTVNFSEDTIASVLEALHTSLRLDCPVEEMVACTDNDKLHEGKRKDINTDFDVRTDPSASLASLGLRVSWFQELGPLFSPLWCV